MAGDPVIIRLVVPGGGADIEQYIVGELRELRADEDNDSLRLHDGTKPGGYEFLNRDQSDVRYQPRSLELDGFDFTAQGKGIVTRVGPASYKLRRLTANTGEFEITNPSGTAGDFYFELTGTITTEHTWDAPQHFVSAIDAQGGLDGETRGLHTGNVVGNVTGNLVGDAVGNHSGSFTGDVDISGSTLTTDPGQILETQIDPAAWIRRGVPQGAILMWSGTPETIPESWVLCDGQNGTPDLRDRFIVGAGNAYSNGAVGGSSTHTHTGSIANSGDHTHPLAVDGHALTVSELPSHNHGCGVTNGSSGIFNHGTITASPDGTHHPNDDPSSASGVEGLTTSVGDGTAHTHTGNTTNSGAHTHDFTLVAGNNLPPYYALCYIMKTV